MTWIPPTNKQIIVLANSRKYNGRCIAGKEFSDEKADKKIGAWLRPVSNREKGELDFKDYRYEDKTEPEILDIVQFQLWKPQPHPFQHENYIVCNRVRWKRTGQFPFEKIGQLLDSPPDIWGVGNQSVYGTNNRVAEDDAEHLQTGSLYLIAAESVRLYVEDDPHTTWLDKKMMVHAEFSYNGIPYKFNVTDPVVEKFCQTKSNGDELTVRNPFLCLSLSEPHYGFCYKLVATLFTKNRYKQ